MNLTSKKKADISSGGVSRNAANKVENQTNTENRISEDVITSLPLNPWNFIDERQVLASRMKLTTSTKKTEDELMTGITNNQKPKEVMRTH